MAICLGGDFVCLEMVVGKGGLVSVREVVEGTFLDGSATHGGLVTVRNLYLARMDANESERVFKCILEGLGNLTKDVSCVSSRS